MQKWLSPLPSLLLLLVAFVLPIFAACPGEMTEADGGSTAGNKDGGSSDSGTHVPPDGGSPMDAGFMEADGGAMEDAGTPMEDAGTPMEDAGTPMEDAGTPMEDAGGQDGGLVPASVCGDSLLDGLEECDDGNNDDDDGCSKSCTIENQCTEGCTSTAECNMGETCVGIPNSVMDATGQCEDISVMPDGLDDTCSLTNPCNAGLVCLGEYLWGDGWCVAQWFAKDFYSYDNLAIPDTGSTISSSLVACGLATVPVDIVVRLHLDHPHPEDLLIELEDPNGQKGTVLDHEIWVPGPIPTHVGSGDDAVKGIWTLHVTDTVSGESGRLLGWSVYLLSNWD
jgi:cysteine-rich repeat protein